MLHRQKENKSDVVERKIKKIIKEGVTPFQEYLFFESEVNGVCISINGDIQSCEIDESIYHEALVHPAMLLHKNPKKVLIMGGGEGGTAREVLKHDVQEVVMVDIDKEFVEVCKEVIPSWNKDAFEDRRLTVIYDDINNYIRETDKKFDVIIGDLVDIEDGYESEALFLYEEKMYRNVKSILAEDGIVASQAGGLSGVKRDSHIILKNTLNKVFKNTRSYGIIIPSFYGYWSFIVASDSELNTFRNVEVELNGTGEEVIKGMFDIPKLFKQNIG